MDRLEIYEDSSREWRWRSVAGNGEIIGGGESYTRKGDAREGALRANPDFTEVDESDE